MLFEPTHGQAVLITMATPKTEFETNRTREGNPKPEQPQAHREPKRDARQSEFPVSERGMNQESGQNKHNRAPKGAKKH